MSEMAFLPMFAATMTSSCLQLFPALTAFPVARVMGRVARTSSSGSALDLDGRSQNSYRWLILSPAIIYSFSTVSSLQSYYWQPEGLLTQC